MGVRHIDLSLRESETLGPTPGSDRRRAGGRAALFLRHSRAIRRVGKGAVKERRFTRRSCSVVPTTTAFNFKMMMVGKALRRCSRHDRRAPDRAFAHPTNYARTA